MAKSGEMKRLVEDMNRIHRNVTLLQQYLTKIHAAREFYSNEGILKQISLFFRDPLGPAGGNLRCSAVYDKFKAMRASNALYRMIDYIQDNIAR